MPDRHERPKDGMYKRFTETAMDEIVLLVDRFGSPQEATKFLQKVTGWKRVKDLTAVHLEAPLPELCQFSGNYYRCTANPYIAHSYGMDLAATTRNSPMEVLHRLAHYLQPPTSPWHGGEFGSIFLNLVQRTYGDDMKRAVKDVMIKHRLKTSVRSEESRMKQSAAYYNRKVGEMPKGLLEILHDLNGVIDGQ